MQDYAHTLNIFLGSGALLLQAFSVLLLALLVFGSKENAILGFVKKNFIPLGLLFSAGAVFFSLLYSEVLHYLPCYHCWIQRIFIFPQLFLFATAYFRKDRNVIFYSFPLLLAGLADSLYLNYLYYFKSGAAPCDASGISCTQRLVSEFGGYISIPSLALTSFVALLMILAVAYFHKKGENGYN